MIKYQITIPSGECAIGLEEIEGFLARVGEENVEILAAPEMIKFWSPAPILRVMTDGVLKFFFGEEALDRIRSI